MCARRCFPRVYCQLPVGPPKRRWNFVRALVLNADDFYCRDGSVTTMHNKLRNLRRQAITNCLPKSSLVNTLCLLRENFSFTHQACFLRTQFRTPKLSTNCQVGKYFHSRVDKALLILSLFSRRIFGRLEGFRRNRNLNRRKKYG